MTKFSNIEDVYMALAQEVIAFVGNRQWVKAGGKYEVYNKMVASTWWLENVSGIDKKGDFIPSEINSLASAGIFFLRDNLLATTGDRIWGVDFTLFPDGKFNVEYDYKKPEDYEESDDVIDGEEINQSMNFIQGN